MQIHDDWDVGGIPHFGVSPVDTDVQKSLKFVRVDAVLPII